jgi:hypothetical protein
MFRSAIRSRAAMLVLGLAVTGAATAQSSGGNISGDALAGETVVVNGVDNGFHRELKVKEDGKFSIRRVPTGEYTVIKIAADGTIGPAQSLVVRVGSTARVM